FSSSFLCYPPLVVPQACADHPALLSFPTRRSSDLLERLRTMGAFAGTSARECYRVTCDRSTMTASDIDAGRVRCDVVLNPASPRSEEHTSELQSRENLVCRLLLEKKKKITQANRGQ